MSDQLPYKLGISQTFPCSYLDHELERLLVVLDQSFYQTSQFERLLSLGFRRSGDQIYRPHCPSCEQCKAMRLPVMRFKASKSQKRKSNKAAHFTMKISHQPQANYYPLYERYINERHSDGAMFPANYEQYESFLTCHWLDTDYIELWDKDTLIAVAVTDSLENSLSAIYTFFDPDYEQYSLGVVMILKQIERCLSQNKQFLYLGYQIDQCQKMNYKNQYQPNEVLLDNIWHLSL